MPQAIPDPQDADPDAPSADSNDAGPDEARGAPPAPRAGAERPRVDLALQGGGSHGAFTWGVLDRLLEDDGVDIDAISGTSAGALNAGVLASAHARGGRAAARAALADFWHDISRAAQAFAPFPIGQARALGDSLHLDRLPSTQWLASFLRAFSPYQFNPLNLNPLRDVLRRHVDEAALRDCGLRLFVTATRVHSGQARVFTGRELSIDALLASACLPFIFQAVEIDGEPYWDGGYTGNPAIYPLIYRSDAADVMLVKINPLHRAGTPRTSVEILDRLSEITFNASLIAEMRAIAFVSRLLREHRLDRQRYKDLRLHMIADDEGLAPFGAGSKLDTDRELLEQLFDLGRRAAGGWLQRHRAALGVRGTLDIEKHFLARPPDAPG